MADAELNDDDLVDYEEVSGAHTTAGGPTPRLGLRAWTGGESPSCAPFAGGTSPPAKYPPPLTRCAPCARARL